jgi:hypothetical protein
MRRVELWVTEDFLKNVRSSLFVVQ